MVPGSIPGGRILGQSLLAVTRMLLLPKCGRPPLTSWAALCTRRGSTRPCRSNLASKNRTVSAARIFGRPAIAQLAEHLTVDRSSHQMVPGSILGGRSPSAGTDPAPDWRGCGAKGAAEERGGAAGWLAGWWARWLPSDSGPGAPAPYAGFLSFLSPRRRGTPAGEGGALLLENAKTMPSLRGHMV